MDKSSRQICWKPLLLFWIVSIIFWLSKRAQTISIKKTVTLPVTLITIAACCLDTLFADV